MWCIDDVVGPVATYYHTILLIPSDTYKRSFIDHDVVSGERIIDRDRTHHREELVRPTTRAVHHAAVTKQVV